MPRFHGNTYALGASCYTGPPSSPGRGHTHPVACETSFDDGHAHSLGGIIPDRAGDTLQAVAVLKQMRRELRRWLKFRRNLNEYIAGDRPAPVLGRRVRPMPPRIAKIGLARDRYRREQELANKLHALLIDSGLAASVLPSSDVSADPDAAAKLAKIAIAGKTPDEVPSAQAQGVAWFVLAIPAAALTAMWAVYVKTAASSTAESERIRCIEAGACSDTRALWYLGAVAGAWFVWSQAGGREKVRGFILGRGN